MKKEFFLENLKKMKINKETWTTLPEIERFELDDGKLIIPNWKYCRFCFLENEMLIQYGISKPYGGRLPLSFEISPQCDKVRFFTKDLREDSPFYQKDDLPILKEGCFIIASNSLEDIVGQTVAIKVLKEIDTYYVEFSSPLKNVGKQTKLSFYDPYEYSQNTENCSHGNLFEGIFMKFYPNPSKNKFKKIDAFHASVKYKNISSIILKLKNNKTFEVKEEEKKVKK